MRNTDPLVSKDDLCVKSEIPFDHDFAQLPSDGMDPLLQIGSYISENPGLNTVIEGHTDATGMRACNVALSFQRAEHVANFLAVHFGIEPQRFKIEGYGDHHPVGPNEIPEGRRLNRRALISVGCI